MQASTPPLSPFKMTERGGIPKNPMALITKDHVRAALKADKGDAAQLSSFTTSDCVEKGNNVATVVARVQVHFQQADQQNQASYVVKINPCRDGASIEEFNRMIFDKENDFYTKIAPELNSILTAGGHDEMRVPRFVYSCMQPLNELIFLEDLRPRGFKMLDRLKGQDEAHVKLVMQELAKLHASSYVLQTRLPQHDLTDKYPSLKKDWMNASGEYKQMVTNMMAGSYDNTVVMLRKIGGYEKVAKWIEENGQNCYDIMQKQITRVPPFEVLCHGDCSTSNMLFRYNDDGTPAEVMLLDHQISRVSSPATDFTYFIFNNVSSDVRRPKLDSFLTCYYSTFSSVIQAGEAEVPFSMSELRQEFRNKMAYGLMFSLMILPFLVSDPTDVVAAEDVLGNDINAKLEAWRERHFKDDMLKNPLVRTRFLDTLDDMVEAGVIV